MHVSSPPSNDEIKVKLITMEKCITKVRNFFLTHNLLINDNKTELIVIGSQYQLNKIDNIQIRVGNCIINPSLKVKNLGVIFDQNLNFNEHINEICRKSLYQLYRLNQLKKYMDTHSLTQLIHAFVMSHIDYCNTLYYNIPAYSLQKLQRIQNMSARVLTQTSKYQHITPILKQLHWLPVKERVNFKIALQVYKCLNGHAPSYLSELISYNVPSRNLRSSSLNYLTTPKINSITFGGRSFIYSAPRVWNELDISIRNSFSLQTFKIRLKTFYFDKYFNQ